MATLRQYFETDFSNTARMHVKFSVEGIDVDAVVLFDFSGYLAYLSCYVPEKGRKLDFFYSLIRSLDYGKTPLHFTGKIILPATKEFFGALKIEHKQDFEILARLFGDPTWVSTKDFQASRRVFIYSESDLTVNEVLSLKEEGRKLGHEIQFRSEEYVTYRTNRETPLAFISHDSRDKDAIVRRIAVNLQKMLCPVWYDEFSLKVGDNLRDSIEKGLKECKKCILVLSPNFLSNNGWTKKEFDSIFTREILEEKKLVLPVWCQVTENLVYEYSPSLLNVKAANWDVLGEEEVCRQLYRVIME